MKNKIWVGTFVVFAILSISVLFLVACEKENNNNTAPSAPTGVSARIDGLNIYVSWNGVSNANYYDLYFSQNSSGPYEYLEGNIYETSIELYFNYEPTEDLDLYFKVVAVNTHGSSPYSSYAYCHYSYGGGGSSTVSAPTGVSAEVSGSRVCVTWNSVSNASYYKVYRASSSSGSYSTIESFTSNTYYYDASPNTYNYYKVTAVNSNGNESAKSDYAYCYYSSGGGGGGGGSAPSAPTGVSAEVSGSKIYVSWNSVSNADEYYIYWSNSSGSGYQQVGTTSNTYYYDNYPTEYNYYKIKAKNSYGTSSYSSYAYCHYSSGGGGGSNYSPCPPTVSASGTASSISVSWTKSTLTGCGNPTSYKVYKRNPFTGSYELKTTTISTSYRDTDVHPGYNRYAVEAINDYGSDEGYGYSSSIALSKPSSFTAQKYQNTYIRCTWSKVSQATGYQISLSTTASGTYVWEQIDDVNTTTKDIYYPGSSGTTVYLKVRAFYDAPYIGSIIYSDYTTYKTVTF